MRCNLKWLAGLALLALGGCGHLPVGDPCTDFGDVQYCLQSSAGLAPMAVTRSVVLSRAQETLRLIMNIEVSEQHGIQMAGLTPFGRRVLWIQLDRDKRLQVASDVPIDALQILAGMQFADWPLERVRPALRGRNARVIETSVKGGITRQLMDGAQPVLTATCEGVRPQCRRSTLRYETLGYSLEIETLAPQTPLQ